MVIRGKQDNKDCESWSLRGSAVITCFLSIKTRAALWDSAELHVVQIIQTKHAQWALWDAWGAMSHSTWALEVQNFHLSLQHSNLIAIQYNSINANWLLIQQAEYIINWLWSEEDLLTNCSPITKPTIWLAPHCSNRQRLQILAVPGNGVVSWKPQYV